MRRLALIIILLIGTADAKTIYVSKAGSNTTPYDTWAKAMTTITQLNTSMAAGDTVYFGVGTWLGVTIIPPAGGTSADRTVYSCSTATPGTLSPEFRGTAIISGGETVTGWSVHSGNVYKAHWVPGAGNGYYDGGGDPYDQSYTVSQGDSLLYPQSSLANVNAAGEFWHNDAADSIYAWCYGSVDPSTQTMTASERPAVTLSAETVDHVLFYGLDLRMGKGATVMFRNSGGDGSGSDSIFFEHCNISRASFALSENPALILIRGAGASPYDTADGLAGYVRWLTLKSCSLNYAITLPGAIPAHAGSGIISYDGTDIQVDSCVFSRLDGDGIEIKNSYSHPGGIGARLTVAHSKFHGIGGAGVNLYTGPHRDSIYGNIFIDNDESGVLIGNSNPDDPDYGDHVVYNNTFYQCNIGVIIDASADVGGYADYTGDIKYNIIYDIVPSPNILQSEESGQYRVDDNTATLNIDIDYNQCYGETFSSVWNGFNNFRDWTYWQETAGNDVNGLNTDPGLNTSTFATTSAGTMSETYGGRTWTVYGAIQPEDEPEECPDTLVAPVFESPANGATGQQNSVILDWSDSTQVGTVIAYDLQVDNNSDYSSITFSSSPTDSRDTVTTALTHLTTYYWRVRSRTACDTSAWSASRTFVVDAYVWTMPARRANPVNSWLDSMSTIDDMSAYLCGMDDVAGTDADTLVARGKWKIVVWSGNPEDAVKVKSRDSTVKLILYNSIDHGLRSNDIASDTSDLGNTWNTTSDEYSHYKKVATDSSKSYYSLFYHFAEDTKILLYPNTGGGYTRNDTVYFKGATLPISDDDSSSIVPDTYAKQFFTGNITLDTISVDTTGTIISRAFRYQGTPQTWAGGDSSRITRVYPDFSNPLTRYAELKYSTRMFAPNLNNLGGTDNDVYGWGLMSDSGFIWDGVYYDNSSDESNMSPAGMTILSGGNIRGSTGVLGKWNADSTRMKMRAHQKTFFAYTTDYCNNGANFSDGIARATSANFGTWSSNQSASNPIQTWFNDSNRINVKLIEFTAFDGAYSIPAYESATTLGYSVAQLNRLDSLARNNDFYVFFSGRINHVDTTVASGWSGMKDGFLRSNWVRVKTTMGHRAIFAPSPTFALTTGYFPCNSSDGSTYGGLIYNHCYNRTDVDQFIGYNSLPFMREYDLGKKIADSSVTLTLTDGTAQTVSVYKTFWRDVVGTDTTYSWMYYFPRSLSSWEWRPSGNHYVLINPPPPLFKRLEYDGTLTTINSDAQTCYIGNQLILSYTTSAEPYVESPMKILRGINLKGVTIK